MLQKFPVQSGDKIKYKTSEDTWKIATVVERAGKVTGNRSGWYNVLGEDGSPFGINLDKNSDWFTVNETENVNIVTIPKHEHNTENCYKAKTVELQKLMDFDTYKTVSDNGQPRISTSWVLWQKGNVTRARLVARGFEEDCQNNCDSPTIHKTSMRIFFSIVAYKQWPVKTTDIKSAFLQSKLLDRDVFIKPPKEAEVDEGKLWQLKRCLYGLNDAARQFFESVVDILKDLGCYQSQHDPALFYMKQDNKLVGMFVSHIDDFLHAGEKIFDELVIDKLTNRFLAGKLETGHFHYVGFGVIQTADSVVIDQNDYLTDFNIEVINPMRAVKKNQSLNDNELTQLRSLVEKLNWLMQGTRPDLMFDMVELSTKFKKGMVEDLIRAIKVLRKAQTELSSLTFPDLGEFQNWKIVVYTDAAHANLCDGFSSMGAQIVFLIGKQQKCATIAWQGGKIKRVVKSTIAAEALSLLEGIELAVYLKSVISSLIEYQPPIEVVVDNRSVVEAINSTKLVDDKRLRLDISAIKQYMQSGEVQNIRWCPGKLQIADVMTKKGVSNLNILQILQNGVFNIELPI